MNPAVVSLKGYANVNRELLTSVIVPVNYTNLRLILLNFYRFFSVHYNNCNLFNCIATIQIVTDCTTNTGIINKSSTEATCSLDSDDSIKLFLKRTKCDQGN